MGFILGGSGHPECMEGNSPLEHHTEAPLPSTETPFFSLGHFGHPSPEPLKTGPGVPGLLPMSRSESLQCLRPPCLSFFPGCVYL